jgi:hypothetical protein
VVFWPVEAVSSAVWQNVVFCKPFSSKYELVGSKFGNEEVLSGLFMFIELQVQLDNLLDGFTRLAIESPQRDRFLEFVH